MRMERKNSIRDSAVGSPDHYNLKNSKHSGCWSPFMNWLSWNMAEGLLFFFETVITWVSRKKKRKKWIINKWYVIGRNTLLQYTFVLMFSTSKHWKLSSPSHFHQQESFIILSDKIANMVFPSSEKQLAVQFWHKFVSRGGINRHQEHLPLLETSTSWKQNTIGPQEGRMTNS